MKKKKKSKRLNRLKIWFLIVLFPAAVVLTTLFIVVFYLFNPITVVNTLKETPQQLFEIEFPEENIPLYQEAANEYGIPWTLLAAHHRIETKFSTMDPLLSPVGAEGHLQFMPCTFVGWTHPTCSGKGQGQIPESEKTDPEVIAKYGGYGVDGNGDGVADPYNLSDALYSAANYLSKNGAADGDLERAIFQYNHSDKYVKDILHYYRLYEEQFQKQ
ncbi:lytic transglycosylase domain-containing protein [Planococcus shenhongbingii]|uniref:Lytic transglycosylase domain-containing protein n=1 Tax=Planococcus shenhongbingii TaxID=3058398 RepID=A0ABT8NCV2_9BACL|nr:lytic transglycosylase domain-containing protein [Planococcus sp. N017]MDN7245688.1 lytic transglycosylase domain-containing protein [Planococcus sp. N017]